MQWFVWGAMGAILLGLHHIPLVWYAIVIGSLLGPCFWEWPVFPRITREQLREYQTSEARRTARQAARWSTRHPLLADAVGRLGVLVVGAALIFWYVQYGPY
jgi:hypothetical protein